MKCGVSGTRKCVDKTQVVPDFGASCYGLLLGNVSTAVLYNIQVMYSEDKGIGTIFSSGITVKNTTVTVKKKDRGMRFCVDYRGFNRITKVDEFPLPPD